LRQVLANHNWYKLFFVGIADDTRDSSHSRQFLRGSLSIAARDDDFGTRILPMNTSDDLPGLQICVVGDGASINHDHVCVTPRGGSLQIALFKSFFDSGTVGLGGTTPEIDNVKSLFFQS